MGEPGQQLPPCPHCRAPHPEELLLCPNTNRLLPLEGRVLDNRFRFIKQLGEGGMSTVWMAENFRVRKRVAIKLMHPEFARNPRTLHRFQNEATAAGRIGNPHICDILDLGESPLGPYIVMEMLLGQSFAELLETQGRIDPPLAVLIICEALKGLAAAHAAGIIHRDLKPENVFLHEPEPGRMLVKLMDFGISKFTEDPGGGRTGANVVMGTPEYMSPEQAAGAANVDARTDIWAMGVMLYRALAGVEPFRGNTMAALLLALSTEDHAPLDSYVPNLDPGLIAVVEHCLAKEPNGRYPSAEAMLAALAPYELAVAEGERPEAPVRTGQTMSIPPHVIPPHAIPTEPPPSPAQPRATLDVSGPTASHPAVPVSASTTRAAATTPSGTQGANTWSSELAAPADPDQSWSMGVRTFSDAESRPYTPTTERPRRAWIGWVVGVGVVALLGGGAFAAWSAGLFEPKPTVQADAGSETGESEPVAADSSPPTDLPPEAATTGEVATTGDATTTGEVATTGDATTTGDEPTTTGGGSGSGDASTSAGTTAGDEDADDDDDGGDGGGGGGGGGGDDKPKPIELAALVREGNLYTHKSRGPNGDWNAANEYCRTLKRKKRHGLTKWRLGSAAELLSFRGTDVGRLLYWTSETSGTKAKVVTMMSGNVGAKDKSDPSPRAFCVSKR